MANFRRPPDQTVRDEYLETERWMTALAVRLGDGADAVERLQRLEAGEPATVQGWEIGFPGTDFSPYLIDGDGQVTPVDR